MREPVIILTQKKRKGPEKSTNKILGMIFVANNRGEKEVLLSEFSVIHYRGMSKQFGFFETFILDFWKSIFFASTLCHSSVCLGMSFPSFR